MSMRKRVRLARRKPVEEAEVIVIPMIDVMMFLLFFFMVASLAMVVQAGLPVNLPKASTADNHSSQNVTITIRPDNSIYLNTTPTTMGGLESALKKLGLSDKDMVILNIDKNVLHGVTVSAMDAARRAGVTHFAIATDRG